MSVLLYKEGLECGGLVAHAEGEWDLSLDGFS